MFYSLPAIDLLWTPTQFAKDDDIEPALRRSHTDSTYMHTNNHSQAKKQNKNITDYRPADA